MWQLAALSTDVSVWLMAVLLAVAVAHGWLLARELRQRAVRRRWVVVSAVVAWVMVAAVVIRPKRVTTDWVEHGAHVALFVDESQSMALAGDGASRIRVAVRAAQELMRLHPKLRWSTYAFGTGPARPISLRDSPDSSAGGAPVPLEPAATDSHLVQALASLDDKGKQLPDALVVVSDGRLDAPQPGVTQGQLSAGAGEAGVPIHGVWVASNPVKDAAIAEIKTAGAAVAHQAFPLTIGVRCTGGVRCESLGVSVDEMMESGAFARRADAVISTGSTGSTGEAQGTVDVPITLDRTGPRVLRIRLESPAGDEVEVNNERYITFHVKRDRVRVLHVAGRPSYDVRAMRQWLKSNASLDVVAFFILRSMLGDVNATEDELALIRFPVDELFTEHLPSFDVVVLQDFDAQAYGLVPYLSNLATYVKTGGGLVLIGGISGMGSGHYAGTALEFVLPVELADYGAGGIDTSKFVPRYHPRAVPLPVLRALRALYGDELPEMEGVNVVGPAKPNSLVLWQHPERRVPTGEPMGVLVLGQPNDGRVVALGVDGTHQLAFGKVAVRAAGRGYQALWDSLLGWLMREPSYEATRIVLAKDCQAGQPTPGRLISSLREAESYEVSLASLTDTTPGGAGRRLRQTVPGPGAQGAAEGVAEFELPSVDKGVYVLEVHAAEQLATRLVFACEKAGREWADTRPDPARLVEIARATGGSAVAAADIRQLELPKSRPIATARRQQDLLPPWIWAIGACVALGWHWLARRLARLH